MSFYQQLQRYWSPAKTCISEGRLDMEWNIPVSVQCRKEDSQKRCMYEIENTSRFLHLETSASSVSLGTRLLQVRDGMNFKHDKLPDMATLCPMTFTNKSILNAEWRYSNIEHSSLGVPHELEKFHHYCLVRGVGIINDHKPSVVIL